MMIRTSESGHWAAVQARIRKAGSVPRGRPMKKKTRMPVSQAAKRRKQASANGKARRAAQVTRRPAAKDDAKAEIRRLKTQLAKAMARIEELQAAADTDFLLGIPNRRGFERELGRAISYIQRYQAGAR